MSTMQNASMALGWEMLVLKASACASQEMMLRKPLMILV